MALERIELEWVRRVLQKREPATGERSDGERCAAVAAVLRARPAGAEVLLIRRAAREGDPWSGHMAFPGGRAEKADTDLLHTAMRETREEIGLDLARHGDLLGRLDEIPAIARGHRMGMTIAPFVFELAEERPLVTNEEVEEVIWAPLTPLASGQAATTVDYVLEGNHLTLPAFDVRGRIVWGLTYRMLESLFAALEAARA